MCKLMLIWYTETPCFNLLTIECETTGYSDVIVPPCGYQKD